MEDIRSGRELKIDRIETLMHQTFDAALGIHLLHVNQQDAEHNLEHFDN